MAGSAHRAWRVRAVEAAEVERRERHTAQASYRVHRHRRVRRPPQKVLPSQVLTTSVTPSRPALMSSTTATA